MRLSNCNEYGRRDDVSSKLYDVGWNVSVPASAGLDWIKRSTTEHARARLAGAAAAAAANHHLILTVK